MSSTTDTERITHMEKKHTYHIHITAICLIAAAVLFIAGCTGKSDRIKNELKKQNFTYDADGFLKSVEDDKIEAVKLFLKSGMSASARGVNGRTPLHSAANFGRIEIAKLLIESGADVNAQNDTGATPLFLAVLTGHKEIAKLLVSRGADVNKKTKDGKAPLSMALEQGDPEMLAILIEGGVDVTSKKEDGSTILHEACGIPKFPLATVKQLVSAGAKPDVKNKAGLTPIDIAKKAGNREIVDYLSAPDKKDGVQGSEKK